MYDRYLVCSRQYEPLEVTYKGCMHKAKKYIQETAMDGVGCFV